MVRMSSRGLGAVLVCCALVLGCRKSPAVKGDKVTEAAVGSDMGGPEAAAKQISPTPSERPAGDIVPAEEGPAGEEPTEALVEDEKTPVWTTAVDPKPLSQNVTRGLAWLVEHQHANGGWAQGEESKHMGRSMDKVRDKPNVGDTCMAVLAFMRSGSTPPNGRYAKNICDGLAFVCKEIEASDEKSLYVTSVRGTRLQAKLGTFIDTFLSSMLLAEAKDKMPDKEGNDKVLAALDKVMDKIERNQRPDGTFGGTGWANTLSLSMASKGMNRASQAGFAVPDAVLAQAEAEGQSNFSVVTGSFGKGGSAGVELYASAANLSKMQDSDNTNLQKRAEFEAKLAAPTTPADEKVQIKTTLKRFDDNLARMESAQAAVVKKLDDQRFIAGFGSNGGEEFLSYMNIGESLVVKGGETWEKWDRKITENLNRIQNKDGSWTGHHCITGRTFCTSASLLVLMTDRAPVPVAAKIKRR